jgi:hypothetical protein
VSRALNEVELAAFDIVARVLRQLCADNGSSSIEVRCDGRVELRSYHSTGYTTRKVRADLAAESSDQPPSYAFRSLEVP